MQECRRITRKSASNLALAFVLLPAEKREGMRALYAFCREVDDVADEDTVSTEKRREQLAAWRADLRRACGAAEPEFPVNKELQPVIRKFGLPFEEFDEILRGVEMDLDTNRYESFEDLELYCYRVASAVGLLSIRVFGYQDPACRDYAIYLGKALQLTNILRDIRVDAERGRIYLPQSELRGAGVSDEEILACQYSERMCAAASRVAERARHFYRLARETLPAGDRRSMVAAELMGSVYWRLLRNLENQKFNVFGPHPPRLNKLQKTFLVLRTWWRISSGVVSPSYGI
jgi:phytoene synthase